MLILPENTRTETGFRGLPHEPGRGLDRVLILGLTLLALVLRMYKVQEWSFWEDEIFSIREIGHSFDQLFALQTKTKHILFPVLQKLFLAQLPWGSEGAYRLLAVILGVITVPAMVVMARSLVGRGPGLLAGLFMAVCPWHIYWSQNNRYYTLCALLSLVTCWLFWAGLRSRRGRTLLILSLVPALLGTMAHPSVVFILAALAAFMVREFLRRRGVGVGERRQKAILYLGLLGVGLAALLHLLLNSIDGFYHAKTPNPLSHLLNTLVYYKGIYLLALAGLSWWPLRRRAPDTADLLLCLILVPLLCIAVLGLWVRVTAQYLFFTYPFYCLLAGWGGWACLVGILRPGGQGEERRSRLLALAPALLVLLPYMAQSYLYFQHEHGWRPRWREAADYLTNRWQPGDRAVVTNSDPVRWYRLKWLRTKGSAPTASDAEVLPIEPLVNWNLEETVDRILAQKGRTWLVVHMPVMEEVDPHHVQWERLKKGFRLRRIFHASTGPKDMTLYVFSRSRP